MSKYILDLIFYSLGLTILILGSHLNNIDPIFLSSSSTIICSVVLGNKKLDPLAAYYSGTFAGMISPSVFSSFIYFIPISLIGVILLHLSKIYFPKVGGRLGCVSFITCLIVFIFK